jgi:hypothetical protein
VAVGERAWRGTDGSSSIDLDLCPIIVLAVEPPGEVQ